MATRHHKTCRLVGPMLATLVLAWSLPVYADLYKYRGADGEIVISTQKRSDLELVEIVTASGKVRRPTKGTSGPAPKEPPQDSPVANMSREERQTAFDDIIREAAEAYDVPFAFVKAVIKIESNFNPNALSHAGAMGLMQLMPKTAASLNVTDPYDPRQNIFGGAKFLRILIDRYNGDINLILAAYNAGDAAVARYDGIPYPKTRGYVSSVYKWYQVFAAQEAEE